MFCSDAFALLEALPARRFHLGAFERKHPKARPNFLVSPCPRICGREMSHHFRIQGLTTRAVGCSIIYHDPSSPKTFNSHTSTEKPLSEWKEIHFMPLSARFGLFFSRYSFTFCSFCPPKYCIFGCPGKNLARKKPMLEWFWKVTRFCFCGFE